MNIMKNRKTFRVALGGVCCALGTVALCLTAVIPGLDLTMFALTSVCLCVMMAETNVKYGVMLYIAIGALGILLLPSKLNILPYIFFFGIFPVVKYFAEKVENRVVSYGIKVIFFLIIIFGGYIFFKNLFFSGLQVPHFGKIGLAAYAILMFVFYDALLTWVMHWYEKRIRGQFEKPSNKVEEIILSKDE